MLSMGAVDRRGEGGRLHDLKQCRKIATHTLIDESGAKPSDSRKRRMRGGPLEPRGAETAIGGGNSDGGRCIMFTEKREAASQEHTKWSGKGQQSASFSGRGAGRLCAVFSH